MLTQEASFEASHISQLTPELLARVLSHLPLQQRLRDCALVSKAWHKSVIMATSTVDLRPCPQAKCDEVSAWLQAHGDAAAISSLRVTDGRTTPPATLKFPTQALRDLRDLSLCGLQVTPADPAAPVLQNLALLTSLELIDCLLTLRGLEGLTSLRRLFIQSLASGPMDESNCILVAAALPALTNLTFLVVDGPVSADTFSQPCSTLQRLEHLALCGDGATAALMVALPPALTALAITCPSGQELPEDVTTTSAQGLCEATGLHTLNLNRIATFHPAVLAKLQGLRRLSVDCEHMARDPGTHGLAILSTLTELQDLKLYSRDLAPAATPPQDYTTLTASSQLTALEAVRLPAEAYRTIFPPGCHLPHMRALTCGPQLLTDHAALQRVIASCPNLAAFNQVYAGPEGEAAGADAEAVVEGLRLLARLPRLVVLELVEIVLPRLAWRAMAQLSGLRSLEVQNSSLRCMSGLLELTACRSLTWLKTETFLPEYSAAVCIKLQNQVCMLASLHPEPVPLSSFTPGTHYVQHHS